jgi:MFS transporter, DHA2 family, multidrug resistance protein
VAQVSAAPAGGQPVPARKYALNPWPIAFTVTIATFMEALDSSIANVALPHIAGNLSATADEATWILTSYLVSNGIIIPLGAWASEVMGRKRFYMTCVALFTVSSFLCGLAPSLGTLILFRVLQGACFLCQTMPFLRRPA